MEVLWVGERFDPGIEMSPGLDGVSIPLKEQARSLGVLLDLRLLLDKKVAAVTRVPSWAGNPTFIQVLGFIC